MDFLNLQLLYCVLLSVPSLISGIFFTGDTAFGTGWVAVCYGCSIKDAHYLLSDKRIYDVKASPLSVNASIESMRSLA